MRNRKVRLISIFFAALLISSIFCNPTFAQLENPDLPKRTGLKVGDVAIMHGALGVSEELETNIYLAPSSRKIDVITLLKPSAGIEIPLRDNRISADYEAGIYMYGQYHSQNHIDHRARGLVELNLTDYKITIKDTFRDYTDRASDENSRRIAREDNNFRTAINAEFDKFGFELGYSNILDIYGSKDDLVYQQISYGDRDRFTNIVNGIVSYRFMPKTSAFLEADIGFINYYNSSIPPGSIFTDWYMGLKGKPTSKILINLKGGFRYQNYDSSSIYADKFYFGPVIKGGLDFLMTKDDTFNLALEKGVYESLYANMNYYDANIIYLKYTHKFNEKMLVSGFGNYQFNSYPSSTTENGQTGKRYDNILTFGCLGRYDIRRWLSAELKYEYTNKWSKFDVFDYVDNRVMVSGTAGF